MPKKIWTVYMVECADKTLYTGISTDVKKRVDQHNTSQKGAKYTRGRRPVTWVYSYEYETKSEALKREGCIKKLSKTQKKKLITSTVLSRFNQQE